MAKNRKPGIQGYIVVWGNGYAGLFDLEFNQLCNGSARTALDDALSHGVKRAEILTPAELDARRGYHRQASSEYFAGAVTEII